MLLKTWALIRLTDVLGSIDLGGEQSRQFSHETKNMDDLLRGLGWARKD